jgi:N-acetylglutamate synthase-like GNAT family acetyltransferase
MKIRKATESDINAIIAVDHVAVHDENRKRCIHEWVSGDNTIVAIVDDDVVGYAVLEYTFFSQGFISMLMVAESSRCKGVGTALVSHLEEVCKTGKLFTSTNESNEPMQALLQSMSYEPSGVVYNLDDGDPELFYFRKIEGNR